MDIDPACTRIEDAYQALEVADVYLTARARHIIAQEVATDPSMRSSLVTVTGVGEPSDTTSRLVVGSLAEAERIDHARSVNDLLGAVA